MARKRLRRTRKIARSTAEKIVDSKKTPEWLKKYWDDKLKKSPKKKVFVMKKRKK